MFSSKSFWGREYLSFSMPRIFWSIIGSISIALLRELGAKLILVWVEAPPEVVRQRLLAREAAAVPQCDSEAGWEIYNRMRSRREKISRNHLVVDTSQDITAAVDKVVRTASR